jgi:hypothetical protein
MFPFWGAKLRPGPLPAHAVRPTGQETRPSAQEATMTLYGDELTAARRESGRGSQRISLIGNGVR